MESENELNAAIEKEQEQELQITNANQSFIQQNYQTMKLEDLCVSTGLSPDVITDYIETYESFLRSRGVNPQKRFVFNISMDTVGTVSYGIEWADPASIEQMLPLVGKLFYMINSGGLRQSMTNFLGRYAEERGTYTIVRRILEDWNKHQNAYDEAPVVTPHEVFKET